MKCYRDLFKKKKIKTMTLKRQQIHNYQQMNLQKYKKNLSKQPDQYQNHRYGDHLKGYQLGGRRGRMGEEVQGLRSITGRYKIGRGMLRIV